MHTHIDSLDWSEIKIVVKPKSKGKKKVKRYKRKIVHTGPKSFIRSLRRL